MEANWVFRGPGFQPLFSGLVGHAALSTSSPGTVKGLFSDLPCSEVSKGVKSEVDTHSHLMQPLLSPPLPAAVLPHVGLQCSQAEAVGQAEHRNPLSPCPAPNPTHWAFTVRPRPLTGLFSCLLPPGLLRTPLPLRLRAGSPVGASVTVTCSRC